MVEFLPLWMFAVMALLLFSGYPVAFVLLGTSILFGFVGHALGIFPLIGFFNLLPRLWGGAIDNLVLTAVPMFIFMGMLLEKCGIAEDLLSCMQLLMRRVPGGLALGVVLIGTILAATTGIIGASVIMMTVLALPTMMSARYSPALASGTIAASGTLGILIPPSIMLVIMGDLVQVSVGALFTAAILPGFLLSFLYCVFVVVACAIRPSLGPPLANPEVPVTTKAILAVAARSFLPAIGLIVLVLGSIVGGFATPTEASGVGALGAFVLAVAKRRLTWQSLSGAIHATVGTVGLAFMIVIGGTAFAYVLRALGGDDLAERLLSDLGLGSWGVLLLLMAMIFLLGFFMEWLEICYIALPIFVPLLRFVDFGTHVPSDDVMLWVTILMAIMMQTSFLTPPFGFALFYIKGAAPPSLTIQEIYRGIVPFVLLQLVCVAMAITFPQIVVWLPKQLLN